MRCPLIPLLLVVAIAASGCERATAPEHDADLYGEYVLYLHNGFALPVFGGESGGRLEGGALELRSDGSYVWTEARFGGGWGFTREGRYRSSADAITLLGDDLMGEQPLRRGPEVLTGIIDRTPLAVVEGDSTVYVRRGEDPPARFRYRGYQLVRYDGQPVESVVHVGFGYLWLFDTGRADHVLQENGVLGGYRHASYTVAEAAIELDAPWGAKEGTIRGDTVTLGPYEYVLEGS